MLKEPAEAGSLFSSGKGRVPSAFPRTAKAAELRFFPKSKIFDVTPCHDLGYGVARRHRYSSSYVWLKSYYVSLR